MEHTKISFDTSNIPLNLDVSNIVIASGNLHKISEIKDIIDLKWINWIYGESIKPFPECEETGVTYQENAAIKALAFSSAAGFPALGDDSGLEVDALNGFPGVQSKRIFGDNLSDAQRIEKLLELLISTPANHRSARFRCTAVLAWDQQIIAVVTGILEGFIADTPSGINGFGYDPVFFVPQYGKTVADLPQDVKNLISHRGRAMKGMQSVFEMICRTSYS